MDPISFIGIVIGLFMVLGGAILEGLHLDALIAPTAFMIVVGGTAGATLTCYSLDEVKAFIRDIMAPFKKSEMTAEEVYRTLGEIATVARREGVLALESRVEQIHHPLLKRGIRLMIDGTDPALLKDMLLTDLLLVEEKLKTHASVYQTAGGFAPCMGIIGTVLGLVHVMGNLSNPDSLGPAIAVAFMATLYGVGVANIVALPLCKKLQFIAKEETHLGTMITEGVLSIQAGDIPRLVQEKLLSFIEHEKWEELTGEKAAVGKTATAS
jgi:chemotaxis protein MotA